MTREIQVFRPYVTLSILSTYFSLPVFLLSIICCCCCGVLIFTHTYIDICLASGNRIEYQWKTNNLLSNNIWHALNPHLIVKHSLCNIWCRSICWLFFLFFCLALPLVLPYHRWRQTTGGTMTATICLTWSENKLEVRVPLDKTVRREYESNFVNVHDLSDLYSHACACVFVFVHCRADTLLVFLDQRIVFQCVSNVDLCTRLRRDFRRDCMLFFSERKRF